MRNANVFNFVTVEVFGVRTDCKYGNVVVGVLTVGRISAGVLISIRIFRRIGGLGKSAGLVVCGNYQSGGRMAEYEG